MITRIGLIGFISIRVGMRMADLSEIEDFRELRI